MAGRRRLASRLAAVIMPLDAFLSDVLSHAPPRVRGTAVFLTANPDGVPVLLLHHFKHNQVLHEQVVLLTLASDHAPFVKPSERLRIEALPQGFVRVVARHGTMETPNVPRLLAEARGLTVDLARTTYYLGRETLLITKAKGMTKWRKWLFALLARNAKSATAYFGIPPSRVVELGMQIEL